DSNIIQQYTAPVEEENFEESEESNDSENPENESNRERNIQRLIWGTPSSKGDEDGQPESSTQGRRRQISRTSNESEDESESENSNLEEGTTDRNGNGLIPLHVGNSAITLNIEINGYRMQRIIDHNFKENFMTRETATKCALLMQSNRRHREVQNLEKTYFPFP